MHISSYFNTLFNDFRKPESRKKITEGLASASIFWISMLSFQRTFGVFKIHAGLPLAISSTYGAAVVSSSTYICNKFAPICNNLIWGENKVSKDQLNSKTVIKNCIISLFFYSLLERNFFLTALPSSIISRGAYARKSGSIIATSETATSFQRAAIQKFGRKYGCHQCGSKINIFSNSVGPYIADHMPPTLFYKQAMSTWWNKLRNKITPIKQRLYPQCQTCFSVQGSNVKSGTHMMVYHSRPRIVHLSPAMSIMLSSFSSSKSIIQLLENKVDDMIDLIQDIL
jgi:hypothetical protein